MSELSTTRSGSRSGRLTSTKETNSTVSSRYEDNSPSSSPVTTRGDDMSRQEQTMDPSGQQSFTSAASRPVTTTTTTTHTSSGSKKRSPECAKQSRENSKTPTKGSSTPTKGSSTPTKGSSTPPVSPAQTRIPTAFWFSETHPMIPRRYVPPWQLDMKNRELTIENCKKAGLDTWEGHISHFWEKRERMAVTNHRPYVHLMTGERSLKRLDSHLSKYNSSMLYFN